MLRGRKSSIARPNKGNPASNIHETRCMYRKPNQSAAEVRKPLTRQSHGLLKKKIGSPTASAIAIMNETCLLLSRSSGWLVSDPGKESDVKPSGRFASFNE